MKFYGTSHSPVFLICKIVPVPTSQDNLDDPMIEKFVTMSYKLQSGC